MSPPAVRIRGIYATSLTAHCLNHDFEVVDPSQVICDRFELRDSSGYPSVMIADSRDCKGVMISGDAGSVDAVASSINGISDDTFAGSTRLARGTIRVGTVTDTRDGGAIIDVAGESAFLPYRLSDGYVSIGNRLAVNVIEPEPPWTRNRRPVVTTRPHVLGRYLTLLHDPDAPRIDSPNRELRGLIELLDPAIPDEWSLHVSERAIGIDLADLECDLSLVMSNRETIVEAMKAAADESTPGSVYVPERTDWVRVGRRGRFVLDDIRSEITHTIAGHHRLKASGNGAGSAVDYLENLDIDIPFKPAIAFDSFGPTIGDRVRLLHGKPDGSCIQLGTGTVTHRPQAAAITVERQLSAGGMLDALDVPIEHGDRAETTYVEGECYAPTVYRDKEENRKGTYVNINSPIEILPDRIWYTDLYIDVIKDADGSVRIVDEDELEAAHKSDILSATTVTKARKIANTLHRSMHN